jgi:beta-1,4-mannosyl-glycoprotein beta-1,4-N-acetylglucosaminyltransferase
MNIYDSFMYFDEDMLLDLRFNILNQYIKKFIITEATYSHNGEKKKLNFDIKKFTKFKNKIEYIVVDKAPPNILEIKQTDNENDKGKKIIHNGYARDNFQREQLGNNLKEVDDNDLIIVSDLDEIPNLSNINFNNIRNKIIIFKQQMFYYKLNLKFQNYTWFGSKACKKKNFKSPQWLRNIKSKKYSKLRIDLIFSNIKYSDIHYINNGGWHFTCIRTAKELQYKLLNFAHHYDFEKSGLKINDLKELILKKKPLYNHYADKKIKNKWNSDKKLEQVPINDMPEYIKKNFDEYKNWLD